MEETRKEITLRQIVERVESLMEKEDRKDALFRLVIALSEVGDVSKYLTHDKLINPHARPHGSKKDEALAFGQAGIQIIALASLRGIDIVEAVEQGLKNWEEADWREKTAKNAEKIVGMVACPGIVKGIAYVVSSENKLEDYKGDGILVTVVLTPDHTIYFQNALAIVTDHGGGTCHAAVIARERNIPCIVGTGNATQKIKHGQLILVDTDKGEVTIQ